MDRATVLAKLTPLQKAQAGALLPLVLCVRGCVAGAGGVHVQVPACRRVLRDLCCL